MTNRPELAATKLDLRRAVAQARAGGQSIGLVPTMGALHEGHLSLARQSLANCDFTIATIFVNPTQFAPHEDLAKYPRTFDDDMASLAELGVDLVFAPAADEIYPSGFSTYVQPPAVAALWEGACRPDHFRGVTTIVLKLFNLATVDIAFFGQKDYQQALVISRMVQDLDVPIEVRVCPIVREPDGLAMSSRNRYLSADERQRALALSRALRRAEELVEQGQRDAETINAAMRQTLLDGGVDKIDYAALADRDTLAPLTRIDSSAVAIIAANVGETRLIDNLIIEPRS